MEWGEPTKRCRQTPGTSVAGSVTKEQVLEIARTKVKDLNAYDEEASYKIIAGTARSMGVEVPAEISSNSEH